MLFILLKLYNLDYSNMSFFNFSYKFFINYVKDKFTLCLAVFHVV